MAKISVCVISFNEEAKIGDCLRSVQPIADEIVVVDSCSQDRTRAIAAGFTDRVIEQPFLGYINQKNFAVDQARHDWILSLDCDERLSDELCSAIASRKDTLDSANAYRMSRKTYYLYRWLEHCWHPDRKVRLFHRAHGRWGGVDPHDCVQTDASRIVDLPGELRHYSYDSISDHVQKLDRFSEIAANEAFANGRRATSFDPFAHGASAFMRQYVWKRGFLDGFAGLTASLFSGFYTYVKYAKLVMMARAEGAAQVPPER